MEPIDTLTNLQRALRDCQFSLRALAKEANLADRTVRLVLADDANPRVRTVQQLHAALARLNNESAGRSNVRQRTKKGAA